MSPLNKHKKENYARQVIFVITTSNRALFTHEVTLPLFLLSVRRTKIITPRDTLILNHTYFISLIIFGPKFCQIFTE